MKVPWDIIPLNLTHILPSLIDIIVVKMASIKEDDLLHPGMATDFGLYNRNTPQDASDKASNAAFTRSEFQGTMALLSL